MDYPSLKNKTWILVAVIVLACPLIEGNALSDEEVRQKAVAGTFYPKNPEKLRNTVDDFLSKAKQEQIEGELIGLMCPHAGYVFSGQVAAYSYQQARKRKFDTVFILGPAHHVYVNGASLGNWDFYETPLGKVPVNRGLIERLLDAGGPFCFVRSAHLREHSIETQLPFLQRVLEDFDIVPILVGPGSVEDCRKLARAISETAKKRNVLLVASSDMSHFPGYSDAKRVDMETLSVIENFDPSLVYKKEIEIPEERVQNLSTKLCGCSSVVTVMMAARELGANSAKVLHYANSGDVSFSGHRQRDMVVGYGAVAFYKK